MTYKTLFEGAMISEVIIKTDVFYYSLQIMQELPPWHHQVNLILEASEET